MAATLSPFPPATPGWWKGSTCQHYLCGTFVKTSGLFTNTGTKPSQDKPGPLVAQGVTFSAFITCRHSLKTVAS